MRARARATNANSIAAGDNLLACGGQETELRIFDISKQGAQKWAAKNVRTPLHCRPSE